MAFSGALQLTDLDDFLAPSQACILPVKQKNKVTDQANGVNPDVSDGLVQSCFVSSSADMYPFAIVT